jgi:hypothetical protein
MLDAYIIDAIRREELEREREREQRRPRLELPIDRPLERRPSEPRGWRRPIDDQMGDPIVIPIGGPSEPADEAA